MKIYTLTKDFLKKIHDGDEQCKKMLIDIYFDRVYNTSILNIVESLPDGSLFKISEDFNIK